MWMKKFTFSNECWWHSFSKSCTELPTTPQHSLFSYMRSDNVQGCSDSVQRLFWAVRAVSACVQGYTDTLGHSWLWSLEQPCTNCKLMEETFKSSCPPVGVTLLPISCGLSSPTKMISACSSYFHLTTWHN